MISIRLIMTVGFVALMAISASEVIKSTSSFLDTHIQQLDTAGSRR